ncbi:glycoside hydrolase family 16 protein [Novosphingobium sp.]|uniref:glycoside hydrolase family 16 protein n=1 Tax=Novosphingobium sp. TaxID=1874826 RepID=UPI0025CD784D|nr:glycoside hydrolase family 16 protein [Novosphingobium sp.]
MACLKWFLTPALLMTLAAASSAQPRPVTGPKIKLCGYQLAWSDEFDDMSIGNWRLDGKRWTAHTPWAGDFGDARFTDPGEQSAFSIRDGHLEITARRGTDGKWTSGLIAAADQTGAGTGLTEGYFETRMRMTAGSGTWPAFWLFSLTPRSDKRPKIELDALEYYGHDPSSYYASWKVHSPADKKHERGELERIPIIPGAMAARYNTVGVLVTRTRISYLFNRVVVWTAPRPAELDVPLFPLVNLALGSGYSIRNTPDPSVLSIDYVRLYAPSAKRGGGSCIPDRG